MTLLKMSGPRLLIEDWRLEQKMKTLDHPEANLKKKKMRYFW